MASMYKYSCSIYGHNSDVRGVQPSPFSSLGILSGSRDFTARLWEQDSDGKGYHQAQAFEDHTNFVSCIAAVAPSEDHLEGLIFTGSSDKIIRAFRPSSTKAVFEMKGHTDNVCTLSVGKFHMLISGSWDKTARVWVYKKDESGNIDGNNVLTLQGHTASVWAALLLQQGVMVTGSADKTIKLWKAGKCVHTFTGHEDCVRGLAMVSACQFLSCANDATVRRWTTTGECLQVYYGHTSFIYSIAMLPGGNEFVTGGEDRSVRVWNLEKKDAIQSIPLPAQSAWDITVLGNEDLVIALSDSTMRVFSRIESRIASEANTAAYEIELSESLKKSDDGISDIDEKNIKDISALQIPGTKDGQVIMVRNNDKVEAHQWNQSSAQWTKVGDVVSAKNTKKAYNGREYDFVFDVDIQEGAPTLKLPYNLDEDPWMAAQQFIDDNELSQDFLDQVCTFIMDNTKEARSKSGKEPRAPAAYDPFTGGTRYVPGDTESNVVGGQDPYTGSGRYVAENSNSPAMNGTGEDPFTGGGRYVPESGESDVKLGGGAAADPMINPNRYIPGDEEMDTSDNVVVNFKPRQIETVKEYFPKEGFITFDNANIDAILGKLKSFSEKCGELLEADLECLKSLTLPDYKLKPSNLDVLWKVLSWPAENMFPALDILRLTCLRQEESCRILCTGANDEDVRPQKLLEMLCLLISATGNEKHVNANRLLSLRTLCNLFESPDGSAFLTAGYKDIFQALSAGFTSGLDENKAPFYGNKNVQIAAATLLLNFAVLVSNSSTKNKKLSPIVEKLCDAVRSSCVEIAIVHLVAGEHTSDPEAIFRYLVCLGTLLTGDDRFIKDANDLGAEKVVETTGALYSSVPKIYECTKSLSVLLFVD
ncbi:phospholipase A-2-activating protein-like [Styela clava]